MQNAPEFYDEGMPCGVLTAEPLGRVLDYRAPEGGCWLGAFVQVPLGPRRVVGVVWGPAEGRFDRAKLRQIIRVLDAAPMRAELREFLTRLAELNTLTQLAPWGAAAGPTRAARGCARCVTVPRAELLFRGDGLPDRDETPMRAPRASWPR